MKVYLFTTIVMSLLLLIVFYISSRFLAIKSFHPYFPHLVGFFFLQSLPISYLLTKAKQQTGMFVMYVLASVGFRFITSLFFLMIFYILDIDNIVNFSIQFIILYFIYLIFELWIVLIKLRRS